MKKRNIILIFSLSLLLVLGLYAYWAISPYYKSTNHYENPCLDAVTDLNVSACRLEENKISLNIKRKSLDYELLDLNIIISNEIDKEEFNFTQSKKITNEEGTVINRLDQLPKPNEEKTYHIESDGKELSVAPIVKYISNDIRTCEVIKTIEINEC